MPGGRSAKQKGDRRERQIRDKHKLLGVFSQRCLLPAQAGKQNPGDLKILMLGGELSAEVKGRVNGEGFKTILGWLEDRDLLFLIKDHADPVVAMSWWVYERLVMFAKKGWETTNGSDTESEEEPHTIVHEGVTCPI